MAQFTGTNKKNTFIGSDGDDLFLLQHGGKDIASGGLGNDGFYFGAKFGAGDVSDGGAGNDQVALQGDYPALVIASGQLIGIETLALLSGDNILFDDGNDDDDDDDDGKKAGDDNDDDDDDDHDDGGAAGTSSFSYNITTNDDNIAAGQNLIINANGLRVGENFTLNGSAETDGAFITFGGFGIETLTGGAGSDGFFFGDGRYNFATDRVNGGGGADNQLGLRGDFSAGLSFHSSSYTNIQTVAVLSSQDPRYAPSATPFSYSLAFVNANIPTTGQLTVNGGGLLLAGETLAVNGAAVTNGSIRFIGGAANDTFLGGAGDDIAFGGLGADDLSGGGGNNSFVYTDTAQSTAGASDTLRQFNAGDIINLAGVDANAGTAGNQDFTYIGANAFSGAAGEVRVVDLGGGNFRVEANTDSDLDAELVIGVVTQSGYVIGQADFIGLVP